MGLIDIYMSLSNTFIDKFWTQKDTEDYQSSPGCLTQSVIENESFIMGTQSFLD